MQIAHWVWEKVFLEPIVLFTLVLMLATVMLWLSTRRLWRISERALTELERPFVFVRFDQAGLQGRGQGQLGWNGNFVASFVNHGRTPAMLTELLDQYPATLGTDMPAPIDPTTQRGRDLPVGALSAPEVPFTIETNPIAEFPGAVLNANFWNTQRLYCIVYIRFRDIFGKRYITGFCGLFDPLQNRFILWGGDGYNYTRREP